MVKARKIIRYSNSHNGLVEAEKGFEAAVYTREAHEGEGEETG